MFKFCRFVLHHLDSLMFYDESLKKTWLQNVHDIQTSITLHSQNRNTHSHNCLILCIIIFLPSLPDILHYKQQISLVELFYLNSIPVRNKNVLLFQVTNMTVVFRSFCWLIYFPHNFYNCNLVFFLLIIVLLLTHLILT